MSEGVVRPQQTVLVRYLLQVFVEHLLRVNDRSYLQEVELTRAVVVQVTCELYLHRSFHRLRAVFLCHLQELRQWEDTLL